MQRSSYHFGLVFVGLLDQAEGRAANEAVQRRRLFLARLHDELEQARRSVGAATRCESLGVKNGLVDS